MLEPMKAPRQEEEEDVEKEKRPVEEGGRFASLKREVQQLP